MYVLRYRILCAISIVIVVCATIHMILAGGPQGAPNFLLQMDVALGFLFGAGHFVCKQRELDWFDRPEKLRKLRLAKQLVGIGIVLYFGVLAASLYDRFSAPGLGM